MKDYIAYKYRAFFFLALFSSCINIQKPHDGHSQKSSFESAAISKSFYVEEFNYKVSIKDSLSNEQLPAGFYSGEVINYNGKNTDEITMFRYFHAYNNALLNGEIDKAKNYYYPEAVKYYKKFFHGEDESAVMHGLLQDFSDEFAETAKQLKSQGTTLNIVVSRPIRKVIQGETVIYVFEITTNLVNEDFQIHTSPDLTVGISIDNGINWTFNSMNEDLPDILRMNYSNEIVRAIMGY